MTDALEEAYGTPSLSLNFVDPPEADSSLLHGATQDSQFEFDQHYTLPSQGWPGALSDVVGEPTKELTFVEDEDLPVPGKLPPHACK
ncbi:unnamed protein product [Gongylonema pulchrum]|uniref:TCF3 fusion partner n=1 Tax=Gongylonema pulchrum TaxID=637853 RepID=A0A183E4G0_9BILA|nr:unnamed protein product [Gongylonema pulchrum]